MKNLARPFILFTFVLLVLGIGGGYLFSLKKTTTKTTSLTPVSSTVPFFKLPQKKTEFQTYMNPVNGYSLSYPKGWKSIEWDIRDAAKLSAVPNGSIWQQAKFQGPQGEAFEVIVWANTGGAAVRSWVGWFRHEDLMLSNVPLEPNTTISGIPALSYVQIDTARKKPLHYLFLTANNKVYEIEFERPDAIASGSGALLPAHPIFDTVAQSFRVIPPSAPAQ